MAGETTITVIGNLTADPELRFTPSGAAVASFTIASTPRTFDRQSNEWKDGETLFLKANIWREVAENVAETLTKGNRVIVQGNLKARTYTTKEGEKRTVNELEVTEVGPSLRYASGKLTRNPRANQATSSSTEASGATQTSAQASAPAQPTSDPWATRPTTLPQSWPGDHDIPEEPPF